MKVTTIGEIESIKKISAKEFNVSMVNAIKHREPELRNRSKAPTFALTFAGTYHTLMKNCGFTEEEAKSIEANYHELYKESDEWIKKKLDECCELGYTTVAFGLRIRTPLLGKSLLNNKATAKESEDEARSVGNAISGQSYGLLNNRAAIAFMNRVWDSDYKYDIMPVSLIHDSIYLMVKDDVRVIEWVNRTLIEEMQWQELEEIKHPEVHLASELELFYKGWHNVITLANNSTQEEIRETVRQHRLIYDKDNCV